MRRPTEGDARSGLFLVAIPALAWGSIPLLVRSVDAIPVALPASSGTLDAAPVVIVFWRVALSALAMLAYMAARRRLGAIAALPLRTLAALALNGLLLAAHWVAFFSALVLTDVAVAELLTYTGPVYVAALTPLYLREPFDRRVLAPIALALAGVTLILGPDLGGLRGGAGLAGAAVALAAAVGYALLMLNTKKLLRGLATSTIVFCEAAVAAVALLPFVVFLPSPSGAGEWVAVATLGLVHSVLLVFLFMAGLRRVRADHAAVLMYLEPLSAVVLASLFLGERVGPLTLVGGATVVAAGILVARLAPSPSPEGPHAALEDAFEPAIPSGSSS